MTLRFGVRGDVHNRQVFSVVFYFWSRFYFILIYFLFLSRRKKIAMLPWAIESSLV